MPTAIQQGGYNLLELPEAPGPGSRFALSRTTHGWEVEPTQQLADVIAGLIGARRQAAEAFVPPNITVKLFMAVRSEAEWVLADRGEVSGLMTHEPQRPGKLGQVAELVTRPGALLDSFALGELAWERAVDREVWEALRGTCEFHNVAGGDPWRKLNDGVARLIALRAGLSIPVEALPHPFQRPQARTTNPTRLAGRS